MESEEKSQPSQKVIDNPDSLKYENKKQVAKGGVLGFFIGLAIIVPGISGSTVAIILKLYEKLLYALGNLFKHFKRCAIFLLPILLGLLIGLVLGFFGVQYLLNLLPFAIVALFAGLMIGAYPSITDQLKGGKFKKRYILYFFLGIAVPLAISLISIYLLNGNQSLENLSFYHYILFIVLGFIIAITQLVPGLSASAILMAFGYFTPLVESISISYWQINPLIFVVYLMLIIGFVLGLFTVAKFLSWLLKRFHEASFSVIAGLSLGSIVTMFVNPEIMVTYQNWSINGVDYLDLFVGLTLLLIGIAAAYLFVRFERKNTKKA